MNVLERIYQGEESEERPAQPLNISPFNVKRRAFWPFSKPLSPRVMRHILKYGPPRRKDYGPNPYIALRGGES